MLSLQEIRRMNAEAGSKARRRKTKLFQLDYEGQLDSMPPFPFPNVGDMADELDQKHVRVDSLFVDSSGFGSPGEPALTSTQLVRKLRDLFKEHGPLLIAIESTGEFQVHVGVWKEAAECLSSA